MRKFAKVEKDGVPTKDGADTAETLSKKDIEDAAAAAYKAKEEVKKKPAPDIQPIQVTNIKSQVRELNVDPEGRKVTKKEEPAARDMISYVDKMNKRKEEAKTPVVSMSV